MISRLLVLVIVSLALGDETRDPNPCGPNTELREHDGKKVCTCLPGYTGNPLETCSRIDVKQCSTSAECSVIEACLKGICASPCTYEGSDTCALNAICTIRNHNPICTCREGYDGDPFIKCSRAELKCSEKKDCKESENCIDGYCTTCGRNTDQKTVDGKSVCVCLPTYVGNPYFNCEKIALPYEACGLNAESKIVDGKPVCTCLPNFTGNPLLICYKLPNADEPCGKNAETKIVDDKPVCICPPNYTGNPFVQCSQLQSSEISCGENAEHKIVDGKPACTCPPNYVGDPHIRCAKILLQDEPCGKNAERKVVDGKSVCACLADYVGNPFVECARISLACGKNAETKVFDGVAECVCLPKYVGNPYFQCAKILLQDEPCGENAEHKLVDGKPVCTCLPKYVGDPFIRCAKIQPDDPCGKNAEHKIVDGKSVCVCLPNHTGNPFVQCSQLQSSETSCGENAEHKIVDNKSVCVCLPNYTGNPSVQCSKLLGRKECRLNVDCDENEACINKYCGDPCHNTCGSNAVCRIEKHVPICSCPEGSDGNPFMSCSRLKCTHNIECLKHQACVDGLCNDICSIETCGHNAICQIIDNNPVCSCPEGFSGDPFKQCNSQTCNDDSDCLMYNYKLCSKGFCTDPCIGACGPNSKCYLKDREPVCSCLDGVSGTPPHCSTTGCIIHKECAKNEACLNGTCINPCVNACGTNTKCVVTDRIPVCSCLPGYQGSPFIQCLKEE